MLCVYELYDLHLILVAIRSFPDNSINKDVVSKIVSVLDSRLECDDINQIRRALRTIKKVNSVPIYDFIFTENNYTYYPLPFLKDERVYGLLSGAFKELLLVLNKENLEQIVDLADCLHNLPIILTENNYSITKSFWKTGVKRYRSKWNCNFLRSEQMQLK